MRAAFGVVAQLALERRDEDVAAARPVDEEQPRQIHLRARCGTEAEAAALLAESLENDLQGISNELEKIALYAGERNVIEREDVEAVIEGLADGTLDVIATDHAPHSILEKEVEFDRAANGIIGLETALAVALALAALPLAAAAGGLSPGAVEVTGSTSLDLGGASEKATTSRPGPPCAPNAVPQGSRRRIQST